MAVTRKLIVTHHAPDPDAIGSVWLLKRFDAQHYANATVAFVNAGETISYEEAQELGFQPQEVTHVDTGLGEFDHHQPENGHKQICASSLVHDHMIKIHPELAGDRALKALVEFITDDDHFGQVFWPDAGNIRYCFMLDELIRGMESTDPHSDESQLYFGMQCFDNAYASLERHLKAEQSITEEGIVFAIKAGKCLAIETRNSETVKVGQKQGFAVVAIKDPEEGNIRVKARPDADIDLKPLAEAILKIDTVGNWYYHPSGKMLINGSRKNRNQKASPLKLAEVIKLMKEIYS